MTLASKLADIQSNIRKVNNNNILQDISPRIMGVSKGQDASVILDAIELGITCFGENRVQEASEKWLSLKKDHPAVELHLIGPLQTNKVKQALGLFDVIETLDRPKLAEEIARHYVNAPSVVTTQFLIQVNTGEEPQKAGIFPKDADGFIGYCRSTLKLPVTGLMCIPPAEDVPAPHFALLRDIARRNGLHELSMGMSDDYEVAVRMGATRIRLGRVLFGERN